MNDVLLLQLKAFWVVLVLAVRLEMEMIATFRLHCLLSLSKQCIKIYAKLCIGVYVG